ncbi:hypothetical protein PF001_g21761 [Phytophthora fragariae]|nr:hypothetical protein PF009_g23560 [Phytophthora fragariae]KAE9285762.1 hypothetical protein PF001_g21761 [Phytophthora fragariae]
MEHFVHFNSRRQLMLFGALLFMLFHIVACIHFGISYIEGFNSNEEEAWISSSKLCLRRLNATHLEDCSGTIFNEKSDRGKLLGITSLEYFRSLYYAVGVLASPGKSVEPASDVQLIAALILMLSGFFITAIVVDNVQKRFTASAFEQKEFFATSSRIQLFLRRQKAPLAIYHRVKSFLDYWWSSHRGAVISELLADLPRPVRLDLLRSICTPVLQTLALIQGTRLVWTKLEEVMVENAQFILYGQGEIVYRHGDYVTGMFFLLEGEVCVVKMGGSPREIPRGSFFGTAVLTQQERGEGYTEHACFPLEDGHKNADALMVFLEVSFVLDMYIRSRLGFYEYGNKMMDLQRIERAYFKSWTFALDIAALLPLYVVNWSVPADKRWDMLNINKLLRLFKVPRQLHALETRYLKRTTELRLFKLLYYTFMLSHVLGCIWFNFACKVAVPTFFSSGSFIVTKKTAFGDNHWLPSEHLAHGSNILQYMASLYWSFGLMSASSEPEFPKTTAQCIFSVVTMTTGFFLFAYVIGNFTDIIELTTAESRDFNAKMGAVRQMLDHFRMPEALQERIKTFLLFKRFHTITQEHILVHCLPPSLLTDIRLVHLKPMIEKVEFLRGMEGSITRMLVSQFTQVLVSRGEFVCKFGRTKPTFTSVVESLFDKKVRANSAKTRGSEKKDVVAPTSAQDQEQLRKVNEISAGSYFGENGLFTNAQRNAYIQAHTSCILYRLSRESLETVFDRYPEWKNKVLRIASIHREQAWLLQLSRDEQRRRTTTSSGVILSRADIMNERAERLKEKMYSSRLQRSKSVHIGLINASSQRGAHLLHQGVVKPSRKILNALVEGVAVQSDVHLLWLRFIVCCTMYVAVMVPYLLAMDPLDRATIAASVAKAIGLQCEIAFIVDIWFSWHIQESPAAMELYDQNLRSMYKKERMVFDIIAAIPFYGFLSAFKCGSWVKLLRCVKIFNVMNYLNELNRRSVSSEITRFWHVWMLYLLVIYWAACAYLAVAMQAGFGTEWEGWLPSQELEISDPEDPSPTQLARRFLRGLFFATTAFVKKARNLAPETASLYAFQIAASFTGLITMSFVLGELASLFISYIGLEVNFRKNHIAVELYLTRLRVSDRLKLRTYAFMTSLWSSHAEVNYEDLLTEMPHSIRTACVLHTSKEPLNWFVMKVISPICWDGDESVVALTLSLAERLQFECYPRDENVVAEGSIVRAMYFVIKGHLKMQSRSLLARPVGLRDGSYFGERGLLGCTISAYTVRTVRACDLLSLSSEAFAQVLQKHHFSRLALHICTKAHKHIKVQYQTPCSRNDMEDRWGEALLYSVKELRSKHEVNYGAVATEKAVSTDVAVTGGTPDALLCANEAAGLLEGGDEEEEFIPGESDVAHDAGAADSAELPSRHRDMFDALDTTTTCYEAFAALLHCMLPTDPLDWDATFATSTNTDLTATLATLSASGTISYRFRSVLPTIHASFNANEEPVDGHHHALHEEQELNQVEQIVETNAEREQEERETEDVEVVAGPMVEDAMGAMVAEVSAPSTAADQRQRPRARPTVLHHLQHPQTGPHVRDLE